MAKYFGANAPFLGGPQNVLSRQTDEQLIKNDLLQLLLTVPGERIYRPDFGTSLRTFTFESLGDQTFDLESEITQAITAHEERVTVNSVTVTPNPGTHKLLVRVDVSPSGDSQINYIIEVTR